MPATHPTVIRELGELVSNPATARLVRIDDHVYWPWVRPSLKVTDQCWGCGKKLKGATYIHTRAGILDEVESAAEWLAIRRQHGVPMQPYRRVATDHPSLRA